MYYSQTDCIIAESRVFFYSVSKMSLFFLYFGFHNNSVGKVMNGFEKSKLNRELPGYAPPSPGILPGIPLEEDY